MCHLTFFVHVYNNIHARIATPIYPYYYIQYIHNVTQCVVHKQTVVTYVCATVLATTNTTTIGVINKQVSQHLTVLLYGQTQVTHIKLRVSHVPGTVFKNLSTPELYTLTYAGL